MNILFAAVDGCSWLVVLYKNVQYIIVTHQHVYQSNGIIFVRDKETDFFF